MVNGKITLWIAVPVMMVMAVFASCGWQEGKLKIGVSMPSRDLQRWNQDGANLKAKLETAGYTVDLRYANNDVVSQCSQIEYMIAGGVKMLVIAAVDGSSLSGVLRWAQEKGISVIAYDRLIMDSPAVAYYATFDNYKVGEMQGRFIAGKLKLETTSGPYNMEIFAGAPGDNNSGWFFDGALSVLTPYIESGKLVVPSGQKDKDECATPGWSTKEAQKRMENLIRSQGYGPKGKRLDVVLSTNDSVANGITNALKDAGYNKSNFPVLTGQDCDRISVKNMLDGTQTMSVFKDTRTLATKTVDMINAIMKGKEPEINDTTSYYNGDHVVPAYICTPVVVTIDNYKKILIDSGYYKHSEVQFVFMSLLLR